MAVGPPATELLKIMLEVKRGGLGEEHEERSASRPAEAEEEDRRVARDR